MWWFANTMISFEEEVSMDMSLPNISRVWPCCIRTPSANVAKGRGSQWWTSPRDRRTWPQRPSLAAAINGESLGIAMDATLLIWDSSKSDASTSMKCGTANYEYQSVPACRSAKEIILIVFFKISSGGTCICRSLSQPIRTKAFWHLVPLLELCQSIPAQRQQCASMGKRLASCAMIAMWFCRKNPVKLKTS